MSNMVIEANQVTALKINKVRKWMDKYGFAAVVISNSDPHLNEYAGSRWQGRSWVSGFDGSNGSFVLTKDFAGLWTDSRYYLIAEDDIEGTEIELFRMNEVEVPSIPKWLAANLSANDVIAIDGGETSYAFVEKLEKAIEDTKIKLATERPLLDEVWEDRPPYPKGQVYQVPLENAGKSISEKLKLVRQKMSELDVSHYLLGRSDEFSWLFNLKGRDIENGTAIHSYCLLSMDSILVFIDPEKVSPEIRQVLENEGVEFNNYAAVFEKLKTVDASSKVLVVPQFMNYSLYEAIQHSKLCRLRPIITDIKAQKNETELSCLRECMVRDGVAMVQSFIWLEKQIKAGADLTEWDFSQQIDRFREKIDDYAHVSFESIVGYNANGALNHYKVTEDTAAKLEAEGITLVDSGGTFLSGTSDTTRVWRMGPVSSQVKRDYTAVFKSLLTLMVAKFPEGATGAQLDGIARAKMWDLGLNFQHSTGHGVGFGLEVHEGPQGFSFRLDEALKLNMVTTIEPGLYRAGEYGIRLENMVITQEEEKTEFGPFYSFENITFCPFDTSLFDLSMLDDAELEWLNAYHSEVYFKLSPHLDAVEKAWLAEACKELRKN